MIRLLVIICFLVLPQDEPSISWDEDYKLSWKDFLAKPNSYEQAAAITASGITFGFSISQTEKGQVVSYASNVKALFFPEQSWYKVVQADNEVLAHEQLHFDITELFARKLRKRIGRLKISNQIRQELKTTHKNILKELEAFQETYDIETNFSRNSEAQAMWNVSVHSQLKSLSEFKSVK